MSSRKTFNQKSFEKWEIALVRSKARKLIGKYGFTPEDVGDISQELLLHIYRKKKGGSDAPQIRAQGMSVLSRILDNRIRDLIDKEKTQKRGGHLRSASFYTEMDKGDDGEILTYEDVLSEDLSLSRRGRRKVAEEEELKLMLGPALKKMNPSQRRICRLLMTHQTVEKVAKKIRMKRPTLYLELKRIRAIFDEEGLGNTFDRKQS